jgi:hypothetical protein
MIGGVYIGPHNSKNLVFGSCLLIAGPPSFNQIGFIVFEQIVKCDFELLLEFCLFLFNVGSLDSPVREMSGRG